jgi:hypothetical protein
MAAQNTTGIEEGHRRLFEGFLREFEESSDGHGH